MHTDEDASATAIRKTLSAAEADIHLKRGDTINIQPVRLSAGP